MLAIPFQLSVVTIYFPVRKPTNAEWEDYSITKIELTAEDPVWHPTSSEFSEQEYSTMKYICEFVPREATAGGGGGINLFVTCVNAADITDDANFGLALENEAAVSRYLQKVGSLRLGIRKSDAI